MTILLAGPTATGKSALALSLADALGGEIVTVDSAQVYRGMDIGTAKPDDETRARVPHHLIDVIAPTESYSAARFCADARESVEGIRARGRVPILAGGTMLYFKAWTEGLSSLPRADAEVRAAIDAEAAERGWPAMHAELARVDAPTAARLAPSDAQRIQRALEVARLTGRPLSSWQGQRKPASGDAGAVRIALIPGDRARLHREIASRFDAMLVAGLVDELASLRSHYALEPSMSSMRCVGYRQAWAFLDGELDREGLRSAGIAATRQLAKRQLTWLRSTPAQAFDPWEPDLSARVLAAIKRGSPMR